MEQPFLRTPDRNCFQKPSAYLPPLRVTSKQCLPDPDPDPDPASSHSLAPCSVWKAPVPGTPLCSSAWQPALSSRQRFIPFLRTILQPVLTSLRLSLQYSLVSKCLLFTSFSPTSSFLPPLYLSQKKGFFFFFFSDIICVCLEKVD